MKHWGWYILIKYLRVYNTKPEKNYEYEICLEFRLVTDLLYWEYYEKYIW